MVSKPIDVFGSEETIVGSDKDEAAAVLSRDGKWLAFIDYAVETGADIWLVELGAGSSPIPAIKTPFDDSNPSFSRDGAWPGLHHARLGAIGSVRAAGTRWRSPGPDFSRRGKQSSVVADRERALLRPW